MKKLKFQNNFFYIKIYFFWSTVCSFRQFEIDWFEEKTDFRSNKRTNKKTEMIFLQIFAKSASCDTWSKIYRRPILCAMEFLEKQLFWKSFFVRFFVAWKLFIKIRKHFIWHGCRLFCQDGFQLRRPFERDGGSQNHVPYLLFERWN